MRELYQNSEYEIAIQSTYDRLEKSLVGYNETYVSKVKYIDYRKEIIKDDHTLIPFLYKRKSFEHEKEIRAIIQVFLDKNDKYGMNVGVNIDKLIERIYVSPIAPQWFFNVVKSVTQKYGYDFEVIQSKLYNGNMY